MKTLLYFEWLHFSRNLARPIALTLFVIAALFGIYNGVNHYQDRLDQISTTEQSTAELHQTAEEWFSAGIAGPADRPWVDINTPFWSMWYAGHFLVDTPKPAMIYNIGQSAEMGYYKRVSMWTTAFDDDLTAEIANAELSRMGELDFSFAWLYLMPLLLIVLTYHTKGLEYDLGFIPLLNVQQPSLNTWLLKRLLILGFLMVSVLTLLMLVPVLFLGGSFPIVGMLPIWFVYLFYLLIWMMVAFFVIRFGKGQSDQALKMIGIWLLLAVAIPGIVNQYVLLKKPVGLMMSLIEASREGREKIYELPEDQVKAQALQLLPDMQKTAGALDDSLMTQDMLNGAYRLVLNRYNSGISDQVLQDQEVRNQLIVSTYWYNPVTGFHNWLNRLTNSGHEANLAFRRKIQKAGEQINRQLVLDEWSDKKINQSLFDDYKKILEVL